MDVDVVVVGAGPVGLTLANILGLQGVQHSGRRRARHADRLSRAGSASTTSRCAPSSRSAWSTMFCRTPCPTRSCGSSTASAGCSPKWRRPTHGSAGPNATASSSRWSMPSCCAAWSDSSTSKCSGARAMASCDRSADGVTVDTRRRGRKSSVRAQYVVGCDGGRSATRRLMGVSLRRHDVADPLAGRRRRQRSARAPQQRGRRRPGPAVRLDLDRARNSPVRVHDSRRRDRRAGRATRAFLARMLASLRAAPRPGRRDPAPGLHPSLPDRRRVPQGPDAAGRRRRAPDAGMAGPGLQQRYPRCDQPRLEARRRGQRSRRGRPARHLRRRTPQARPGHDRPVHDGGPGHLTDQSPRCRARDRVDPGRRQLCPPSSATCWRCGSSRCRATSRVPSCTREARDAADSPVGTLFIQPRVDTREQQNVLLDDVLGTGFAVLCWNNNPREAARRQSLCRLGRRWAPRSSRPDH